jgi:hypothetical protein
MTHLIKFPSDYMYIWSYCSEVVECLFITDVACAYDLTYLARNLPVSLIVVIEVLNPRL